MAYLFALTSAIIWAVYSNLTHLWGNPEAGSAVLIFIPFTALIFNILRFVSKKKFPAITSLGHRTLLEIAFFIIATILAYLFWDISMRKTTVTLVAVFSYFTPLLSTIIIGFYLKEKISKKLWFGCFLLIVGSLVSWLAIGN